MGGEGAIKHKGILLTPIAKHDMECNAVGKKKVLIIRIIDKKKKKQLGVILY